MATNLAAIAKQRGIKYFLISYVDLFGTMRAKLVPAAAIADMAKNGAGFAGFASWLDMTPADPDVLAIPDPDSLIQLPWRKEVGWLAADPYMNGKVVEQAPRNVLKQVIADAASKGYAMKSGVECEFFLISPDGMGISDAADHQAKPCYDQQALMRRYDVITEICDSMLELGWGAYQNDHEDANGQFEHNWDFADALTTCDRAIFFRYMVEALAQEQGMIATFMPKPFADRTGNGCHMHLSLWKDGVNVFHADPADDPRGLGLSPLAYNFLGGLKQHAKAYIAVTAPTVTSYKRLVVGETAVGGATWAPVDISYGANNRTQMLRIPGPGRIEDRTVDGSCNPYLAATAVLAAGLDGIARGLEPGDPVEANLFETDEAQRKEMGVETLPANLLDATRELERCQVMRAALGACATEDYIDYFVRCKRKEWQEAHEQITQWELDRYLQLY